MASHKFDTVTHCCIYCRKPLSELRDFDTPCPRPMKPVTGEDRGVSPVQAYMREIRRCNPQNLRKPNEKPRHPNCRCVISPTPNTQTDNME